MNAITRGMLRVAGNFGMSFLSPLMGTTVVLNTEFYDAIVVSLISAALVTGFALSREVSMIGQRNM